MLILLEIKTIHQTLSYLLQVRQFTLPLELGILIKSQFQTHL